jgi:serine/threonine protein phosphatase 1
MISNLLKGVGLLPKDRKAEGRPRIHFDEPLAAIYAIGDVHGCLDQLRRIEDAIVADSQALGERRKLIVMLGDYVDRGPSSSGVLEHLLAKPPLGFERICLAGNHEVMMLEHLEAPRVPSPWIKNGGDITLDSYGISAERYAEATMKQRSQILASHIPDSHLELLRTMPSMVTAPGLVFAHGGVDRHLPLESQEDSSILWMRHNPKDIWTDAPFTLIHGHTPVSIPLIQPRRINIDTGCFATGKLTAVRMSPGRKPRLLYVGANR